MRPCRALGLAYVVTAASLSYAGEDSTAADLILLDFEELVNMDVEVSSAGKQSNRVMELPYAAHVLSAKEIVASGAQTIPEALRLIPGLFMGQISANEWYMGMRGVGGGRYSKYVLVMVDGRIAFNSLFSGVNWDELNYPLSAIDRIEVVRGPNAAAWGANAVNGIIHIITKRYVDGELSTVSAWAGSNEHAGANAQFFSSIGGDWELVVNTQLRQWGGNENIDGWREEEGPKDWRASSSFSRKNEKINTRFTVDAYGARMSPYYAWIKTEPLGYFNAPLDEKKNGYSFVGEQLFKVGDSYDYRFRAALSSSESDSFLYSWDEQIYQVDLEFNARWSRHQVAAGVNWRRADSEVFHEEFLEYSIRKASETIDSTGVYLSDRITLSDSFSATLALRWDDHDLAKPDTQPSLRLLWQPDESSSLWFAASTATAAPSRTIVETKNTNYHLSDASLPDQPLPVLTRFTSYQDQGKVTKAESIELGWRKSFDNFNIDISVFDVKYRNDLFAVPSGMPNVVLDEFFMPRYVDVELSLSTEGESRSEGIELTSRYQVMSNWSSQLSYSRYSVEENRIPAWSQALAFQNSVLLNERWTANATLRYMRLVDAGINVAFNNIAENYRLVDSYVVADLNLDWQMNPKWKLQFIANNVGEKHVESSQEQFAHRPNWVEPYALMKLSYLLR